MAILTASNLSQSFGALDIFSGVSVSIPNDGKIGLVGPNGVGKTSLMLILANLAKPASGTVHWARGRRLGYLPQEATEAFAGQSHSVFAEMLTVFSDLQNEERRLRQMETEMADGDLSEALLEQYGTALEKFELAGGYEYELNIKQVLHGLGFDESNWSLQVDHLSGGQKTRALLARLLLEKPDLLILDEPTNHLDVEAVEWLEGTLKNWEGAILLVSHDRYFLDRVVNIIWEMSRQRIEEYRGNYSAYLGQRQERWARRELAYESQKERLEKELEFIRKNIAAQNTQVAKGKLKRISRELDAIQRGGLEALQGKSWSETSDEIGGASRHAMSVAEAAEAIKGLSRPDGNQPSFQVNLKRGQRSGEIVLRTSDLTVGYPNKPLFVSEDIELRRLECAALIGPNGSGKTTFLRTILGGLEPLAGQVRIGASVDVGYFAQAHELLNPEHRVIDELMVHHPMLISEARSYLGRYHFRGDDAFKSIRALSGGERGRLALAILALEGANFLLLDEPTNHLDIPAQEMLQEVLEQFDGTILLVSHDRYLVDRLATQLWLLDDGRLVIFKGPYQEYLAERTRQAELAKEEAAEQRDAGKQREQQAKAQENARKKRLERLAQIEGDIAGLESELERIGLQLQKASGSESFDKIQSLSLEYAALEDQLEQRLREWEILAREQSLA